MNPNADSYPVVGEPTPVIHFLLTKGNSRRTKSTSLTSPVSLFTYDALARLLTQQEPWVEEGFKITCIHYLTNSLSEDSSKIISEFILDKNCTEYFLKNTQYYYTETPELKREIIFSTTTESNITRKSLREWFGNSSPDLHLESESNWENGLITKVREKRKTVYFKYDSQRSLIETRVLDTAGIHDFYYSKFLDQETEESSLSYTRITYVRDPWGRPSGHTLYQKESLLQKCDLQYDSCNRICRLNMNPHSFFLFTYHPQTGKPFGMLFPNGVRQQYISLKSDEKKVKLKYCFPQRQTALEYTTSTQENTESEFRSLITTNPPLEKFIHEPLPEKIVTFTGVWHVQHDDKQLPTHFRQGDLLIEFLYDYRGRRAEKKIFEADKLVERICYTYSGTRLLCEFDHTTEIPIPMCSYLWHPLIPAPLALTLRKGDIQETCYYLIDPDNNVRALVDDYCRLRATYQYDQQGTVTEKKGDLADLNPFHRGTLYHDEELGFSLPLYFPNADEEQTTSTHAIFHNSSQQKHP